jgi:hypothetical protein
MRRIFVKRGDAGFNPTHETCYGAVDMRGAQPRRIVMAAQHAPKAAINIYWPHERRANSGLTQIFNVRRCRGP